MGTTPPPAVAHASIASATVLMSTVASETPAGDESAAQWRLSFGSAEKKAALAGCGWRHSLEVSRSGLRKEKSCALGLERNESRLTYLACVGMSGR